MLLVHKHDNWTTSMCGNIRIDKMSEPCFLSVTPLYDLTLDKKYVEKYCALSSWSDG